MTSMPDDSFDHPRLVALYDLAEADRADLVHYEALAVELGARSVIDVGCGTGTLACRLASAGIDVIGVDPALASLNIARAKPTADRVRWIHGEAASLGAPGADLAVMTGNVAQVFLTDDDWMATIMAVHEALRPGGHFVFETRNPAFEGWLEWTKDQSYSTLVAPNDGRVESWVDLVDVSLPYVSFEWTYRFASDGAEMRSQSTLRFRDRAEVARSLESAGFTVLEVREAPDRPGKEFVFIARRST